MREKVNHPVATIVRSRGVCYCLWALLAATPNAWAFGPISAGDDVWATPCGGGAYLDFSANPIPADFFGPGSDPFTGQVILGGDPSGILINPPPFSDIDTIVRRGPTSPTFGCGSVETVPIEIVALSLVSCSPITVTFNGGTNPELWDVRVCLDGGPQPTGTMTIAHECQEGGSYTSQLPVNALLTFTSQGGAGSAVLNDSVNMGSNGWWSHFAPLGQPLEWLQPGTNILDACTGSSGQTANTPAGPDFFPGLWSFDCSSCTVPGNFQKPGLTPEQAMLAAHGIYVANQKKRSGSNGGTVVTEACCLPGGNCVDVPSGDCQNLWGGIPQGPGTNCANTVCGGGQICPLDPADPVGLCAPLQTQMCTTGTAADLCLPSLVQVNATGEVSAVACECFVPGPKCGPVSVGADGNTISCPGDCPAPNPIGTCTVFANGLSQNASSVSASNYPPGTQFSCNCAGPPPDDHITVDPTQVEFGGGPSVPAIPAGFFDPGSDPFTGIVPLEGDGSGPSVSLRRSADPVLPSDPPGANGTVEIEIVALSLRSVAPITVTFNGGQNPDLWELTVSNIGSSGKDGVSRGTFDATKDHPNGGDFTADFEVCPVLTFRRLSDGALRTLDLCPDPVVLTPLHFNIAGPFTHNVDPGLGIAVPPGATMTTGIEHEDIGIAQQVVAMEASTKDVPPSVIHWVEPPPLFCPLPGDPAIDPCAPLQMTDCQGSTADQCRPTQVTVGFGPVGPQFEAITCDCITPGNKCGPIDISPDGQAITCPGGCPAPNPPGNCYIHVNGTSIGVDAASVTNPAFAAGDSITCACTQPQTGACCYDSDGDGINDACVETTQADCSALFLGTYQGDGTLCQGVGACCYDADGDGFSEACIEVDGVCCDDLLGTFQGAGSNCNDADANGIADVCEIICTPNAAGTACEPIGCSAIPEEQCLPHCVNVDPLTGAVVITDCDCRDFNQECWVDLPGVGPAPEGPGGPCVVTDNGTGTITLPPAGCEYLSPEEVHMIIDGLPPGTTIELAPIHRDFLCATQDPADCSFPLPPGECERPGGSLGGSGDCFQSSLVLNANGTGALAGFSRNLAIQVATEVHTGPRNPGDAVQDFDTEMFRLQGQLPPGDPDFDLLRITAGSDFGLPSPGHTTLTRLGPPGSDFHVDSFFDITYRIDFVGAPGGPLAGMSGSTTGTIRMQTGGLPNCTQTCPPGETCERTVVVTPTGTIDVCCDCVPEPTGACCRTFPPFCIQTTAADCFGQGTYLGDGTPCGGVDAACCLPGGGCIDADTECCVLLHGGTPQAAGTTCNDVTCPQPACEPDPTGTACTDIICPDPNDLCQAHCAQFDPLTGATTITDCECLGPNECHVDAGGPVPEGGGNPCVVGNVGGTVVLPPAGCDYLSPDEVHMIVDGLPAGTTIELEPIHNEFICGAGVQVPCSQNLGANCEGSGGDLGGNLDCSLSNLQLQVTGHGPPLDGWTRVLNVQMATEVHTGPRTPGNAVQDFDTDMFRLSGELFGDPDFCLLRITAGSDFGLPSPGHTTLRRLGPPGSNFAVDSFFDITYRIEFQGCPGSILQGMGGSTTATIRMETGAKPNCVGGCPAGETCVESLTVDPVTGVMNLCCDCVAEATGACCTSDGGCAVTTQLDCIAQGGTYAGDNTTCGGVEACCRADGSCIDIDRTCCALFGGMPQGAGTDCANTTCPLPPCEPNATGTACEPVVCPDDDGNPATIDECQPRCVRFDPATGASTVIDCDCRDPVECHAVIPGPAGVPCDGPSPEAGPGPCVLPDTGGTVVLPPPGCPYLSPEEVHEIIGGLPAGTTIELAAIHDEFSVTNSGPGGSLGGEFEQFQSILILNICGTGALGGFNRFIAVPVQCETHIGPRTPGDPVQSFDTDMFRLQGQIFGDPDFDQLIITGGTDFGMPSPGHTTLTKLPSGNFNVDSFFDIEYRVDFVGAPGSVLDGLGGSTTATIRMKTGSTPTCEGGCPPGQVCEQTQVVNPDGTIDICCDCVAAATGACCIPGAACFETTQVDCEANGGQYAGDNVPCGPLAACCLPNGACVDVERACCVLLGGVSQPVPSDCTNTTCPQPTCEPDPTGTTCVPDACSPIPEDRCLPRCVTFDPFTGATVVTDCDCVNQGTCHVGLATPGGAGPALTGTGGDPCVVTNVGGTVELPPIGCDYLSPEEVHMIIDGLPAGVTIELGTIHKDFICQKGTPGACSVLIPPPGCEAPGGSLGGHVDCFGSFLEMDIRGTAPPLATFQRNITMFVNTEVHTGPRTPGDAVQDFDTDMFRLSGQLPAGDPDFCLLRITAGSDFGLPSPGHTTLTRLGPPGSSFQVDSFFDIEYRIEFQGCPGSPLDGMGGTTTGTIRMKTGGVPPCVGDCPAGEVCQRETVVNADGTLGICCNCVPACDDKYDCGDVDNNGVTDDVCTWYDCVNPPGGSCLEVALQAPSDMGGAFGACLPDGFCNIHDANHALACFSNLNTCSPLNIDAGGSFGACDPDGFCNIHDANHALACFSGLNTCTCGPAPTAVQPPRTVGKAVLSVVADRRSVRPGEQVQVRVFVNDALANLQSYQLHVAASGGRRGQLELVDVSVEQRADFIFAGHADTFDAFNVGKAQMIEGLLNMGIATGPKAYLATFTYRVSPQAVGTFVVDVLHDESASDQTFLVSSFTDKVEVAGTTPAVITVTRPASGGVR